MQSATPPVLMEASLGFFKPYVDRYPLVDWTADTLEAVLRQHADVRAVIATGDKPLPKLIESLPSLELVALISAGYDGVQTDRLLARGVKITNAAGANAADVANQAMALFLALMRRVVDGDRRMRAGLWVDVKGLMSTPSIHSMRVGIVGMGAIGKALARRLAGFECEIAWWGPNPKPDLALPRADSVLELARTSDVLFLAHRADESNRGLVDDAVLEALGPRGYLVNVSRGSAVDEATLIAALRDGVIAGAGIDVYEPEPVRDERWADVPNCVLSPHVGGIGLGTWRNVGAIVLDNLDCFYAGRPLVTPISGA